MTSSKQETLRQRILHYWRKKTCNAIEIHSLTKIPPTETIKVTGEIKRKSGSGRIKIITPNAFRVIVQYIRREPSISANSVAAKLEDVAPTQQLNIKMNFPFAH
ncbi:16578_t:CDS:1 [Funneliformis caledonium]|uniref:16578_t:CDS:1 n=1 Tax=Funneliformis caledonium TaxID=1117310 RepID=A0A9N9EYC4_9GLOM|nr:16578_t:CDS:1 [Funneliformis caledonium]